VPTNGGVVFCVVVVVVVVGGGIVVLFSGNIGVPVHLQVSAGQLLLAHSSSHLKHTIAMMLSELFNTNSDKLLNTHTTMMT